MWNKCCENKIHDFPSMTYSGVFGCLLQKLNIKLFKANYCVIFKKKYKGAKAEKGQHYS